MQHHTRLILATVAATAVLGALVASASANRIAVSSLAKRAVWTALEFTGAGGIVRIKCPVTLEGSFHSRTFAKVLESLVGYVTRAVVAEASCTGGTVSILTATLPWHMRFNGFTGTLPTIRELKLRVIGVTFLFNFNEVFGLRFDCLIRSTAASPMQGWVNVGTGGVIESLIAEAAPIPLSARLAESTGNCPSSSTLGANAATVTDLGSTTKITVTLVV